MDIKEKKQPRSKLAWSKPRLTVHGTVEKITAQHYKDFGSSDGLTYQGIDIKDVS